MKKTGSIKADLPAVSAGVEITSGCFTALVTRRCPFPAFEEPFDNFLHFARFHFFTFLYTVIRIKLFSQVQSRLIKRSDNTLTTSQLSIQSQKRQIKKQKWFEFALRATTFSLITLQRLLL